MLEFFYLLHSGNVNNFSYVCDRRACTLSYERGREMFRPLIGWHGNGHAGKTILRALMRRFHMRMQRGYR